MPDLRTGSLGLDILLNGGWKPGTINEIWGEPGSGKSVLARHTADLSTDTRVLWMCLGTETPHSIRRFLFAAPRNAEEAFETMLGAARHNVPLIVVDSANGLVRQCELDGDPDYVPHPQREYKDELSALKKACKASGTVVLFLSKPRDHDRQPVRGTGISEKARSRAQLRIVQQHQDETRLVRAQVKAGDEFRTADFVVRPGAGIDRARELAVIAVDYKIINRNGNWYKVRYGDTFTRYQGIESLAFEIEGNPRLATSLDEAIRFRAGILN